MYIFFFKEEGKEKDILQDQKSSEQNTLKLC